MDKPSYEELEKELSELKTSFEFLDQIINNVFDPVFVKDSESRLIYVNDAFCDIFEAPRTQVIGKTLAEHVPVEEREHFLKVDREVVESGKTSLIEETLSLMDKVPLTIRTKKTQFINKKGDKFLIGVIHDITDSKNKETELEKAKEKAEESDRLKTAFLANMSHEIRTPMNGILGFSELLKGKNISSENRENYIDLIEKEGNRLLSFINDIVDISKIESKIITLDFSSCNLNELFEELHSKYAYKLKDKDVNLHFKKGLGDPECVIRTDTNKLVQILSNLLENAIKFTKSGEIEFGYSQFADELKFFVRDSGIGIRTEDKDYIFRRFTQSELEQIHNPGAGLGLSIVKGLVEILDGEVWVDSKLGEGSTFYFTIPYQKVVDETKVLESNVEKALPKDHFTICIVEDEIIIFMYLKAIFSKFNCTVLHAKNGKVAVELFKKSPSVDIILMDINMPEMDGYEAVKRIREINKTIPIIAQSGLAMSGDKEKILNAGFDDYVSKPISRNILISKINKHLKRIEPGQV